MQMVWTRRNLVQTTMLIIINLGRFQHALRKSLYRVGNVTVAPWVNLEGNKRYLTFERSLGFGRATCC